MKEEILEILNATLKSGEDIEYMDDCAKEIADHFKEFIEWTVSNCSIITSWSNTELVKETISYHITFYNDRDRLTLDELFDYWLTNIYKK